MNIRLLTAALLCGLPLSLAAQDKSGSKFEVYGYVMTDAGYNFKQSDPNWFDVVRTTKLPAFEDQFAPDGNTFFSVRQTRFGVRSTVPTDLGDLKTTFEFELFGTGADAGQTTFRLRHAYGELGQFGAGQTWSPFMDVDVFPNSLEYWGPAGMVFFRNLQVRWMPIKGDSRLTVALERPGASADQGLIEDRIELDDVRGRFPVPDLSAEYRHATKWGYIEAAGMLRYIKWEDQGTDAFDLSGDAVGWGINLSSNVNLGKRDVVRLQAIYGTGVQNYMNDAPADVGIELNPGNPTAPVKGVALPVLGIVAFLDHTWNEKFTSSVGYSMVDIDNSELQAPSAFKRGQYALGNVLYTLAPGVTTGAELQWGDRENFSDGFSSDQVRIQFSFKYAFSKSL
ncbi:MAG: DcaP family trimeric outer membrane transporter [Gemmatimonadales bacterium]